VADEKNKTMMIREAVVADIPRLVELRMRLFADVGMAPEPAETERLREATRAYFSQAMPEGVMRTWVADNDGELVGTGSVIEFIRPPYPANLAGREAYVLNMYVLESHRRQGLARRIFAAIMDDARARGYAKVCLHASPDGKALYESFDFVTNPTAMEWHV
jgi:GNAT superfamily N-acetyltransferase